MTETAHLGKRKNALLQVQLYTPASIELYSRKYKVILPQVQSYGCASVIFAGWLRQFGRCTQAGGQRSGQRRKELKISLI